MELEVRIEVVVVVDQNTLVCRGAWAKCMDALSQSDRKNRSFLSCIAKLDELWGRS